MVFKLKYHFFSYSLLLIVNSVHGARTKKPSTTEAPSLSTLNRTNLAVIVEEKNVIYPTSTHQATVIILHLQGAEGTFMREWMQVVKPNNFALPHIKLIFPHAPCRNYSLYEEVRNIWFDRTIVNIDKTEDLPSFEPSIQGLTELIRNETQLGIPLNKIAIGGMSMGGAMAMHMAYRFFPEMAGVFAISSTFLPRNSSVYSDMEKLGKRKFPPVYFTFGREPGPGDSKAVQWGKETFYELRLRGVNGEYVIIGESGRDVGLEQLNALWEWFKKVLE